MKSRLLTGKVGHRRRDPAPYDFRYDVFYLGINLAELDTLSQWLRPFSYGGRNLLTLQDRDHMDQPGLSLADATRSHLAEAGCSAPLDRLELITYPRVLGYVFNPVSFYLVRDDGGGVEMVIAEVHNKSGERHCYDMAVTLSDGRYQGEAAKEFYVSPFMGMAARYELALEEQDGRLSIALDEYDSEDQPFFQAWLELEARPLTNTTLTRALLRQPLVTAKTSALIYWHALKLWRRGVPFYRNPGKHPRTGSDGRGQC